MSAPPSAPRWSLPWSSPSRPPPWARCRSALCWSREPAARSWPSAHNRVETWADGTAHAELIVLQEAARRLGAKRLVGVDLYVTLEPCPMCAAAISLARLRRLYFGAYDPKSGGVEHGPRIFSQTTCHHRPEVDRRPGGAPRRRAAAEPSSGLGAEPAACRVRPVGRHIASDHRKGDNARVTVNWIPPPSPAFMPTSTTTPRPRRRPRQVRAGLEPFDVRLGRWHDAADRTRTPAAATRSPSHPRSFPRSCRGWRSTGRA